MVFWATSIATSLLPIAAEYRAAYSDWSIQTVWVTSLLMGMIIAYCVSWFLLRFYDRIPTKNPVLKSVLLSFIVLIVVTILIEGPASLLAATSDALRCFLIGAVFNAFRILALGVVVGLLYSKLNERE